MLQISKEEYKKCEVEVIGKGINTKDLETKWDVANWAQIFDKCDPKKHKYRHELMPNTKFQQYSLLIRNDFVEKTLKAVENHQKGF